MAGGYGQGKHHSAHAATGGRLNDCLGRGEHREMFHHSDDAGNPGSHMGDNFPATFYLPRAMEHRVGEESVRFDEVCVVADRKSFSLLVECIKATAITSPPIPTGTCRCGPASRRRSTFSNVRSDAQRSLAKPAFPGGMGILPPVQGLPLAGICWATRETKNGYSTGRRQRV